jgi:hypothetical protein
MLLAQNNINGHTFPRLGSLNPTETIFLHVAQVILLVLGNPCSKQGINLESSETGTGLIDCREVFYLYKGSCSIHEQRFKIMTCDMSGGSGGKIEY